MGVINGRTGQLIVTPNRRVLVSAAPPQPIEVIPAANRVFDFGPAAVFSSAAASVDADLEAAAWSKSVLTITGDGGSPEIFTLTEVVSGAANHLTNHNPIVNGSGGKLRAIVEAKKPTGGRDGILLYNAVGTAEGKFYNLSTGALGDDFVSAPAGAAISALGDGWYRCQIDFSAADQLRIYLADGSTIGSQTFAGDGRDALLVRNVSVTQLRHSAYADQFGLHSASQGTAAAQPLWGPNALGASREGVFDGTDDYMTIAAGAGWPGAGYTSHHVFALLDPNNVTNMNVVDFASGRLAVKPQTPSGNVGIIDGAPITRELAAATTGPQILEWQMDAGAGTVTGYRHNAAGVTALGSDTYVGTTIGGTAILGANSTTSGAWYDGWLGRVVWTAFASGVMPEGMRQATLRALLYNAELEGWL